MTKELEALEVLKCGYKDEKIVCISRNCFDKSIDIIETALKEKENIEKSINELFSENGKVITTIEIKKKLKALEIIKEKSVQVADLLDCIANEKADYIESGLIAYNEWHFEYKQLTQEEFDLLKEVLL